VLTLRLPSYIRSTQASLAILCPSSDFVSFRSKGLTELALARLGYADTIIFRPGFLRGAQRGETRLAETIAGYDFFLIQNTSS
jgi:hypothetical protein